MDSLLDSLRAELAGPNQSNRLLRLHTVLGADRLLPERVSGWEAISRGPGFCLDVTALSTDARLNTAALIGSSVLLELLTAESRVDLRPWHGHITAVQCLGSNQGVARYLLRLEPWLALLAYRQDCFLFQDMSVPEIAEQVFSRYIGGEVALPAWRWALASAEAYPVRSVTTQYQETDLAFLQRLFAEEGLYYWFEHEGDAGSAALGQHRLVISDHNGGFAPAPALPIRFHRADATEREDSVQHWRVCQQRQQTSLSLSSWDYRSRTIRLLQSPADGAALPIDSQEMPGHYDYPDLQQGERRLRVAQEADAAWQRHVVGAGRHRQMAPGLRFRLSGHAAEAADHLCCSVTHTIRNNLSAQVLSESERLLGSAQQSDAEDFYANRFQALPASTTFRRPRRDLAGRLLHPRPEIHGLQTAVVVGPADVPVHCDRDHRIKVQFHWQRGTQAYQSLTQPEGQDNAPGTDALGSWLRVSAALAGDNWGSHFVPRVGQEVLVRFIDGNIDRPLVVACVYNGQGEADAQGNSVTASAGRASANAAAWFAGGKQGHAHPATLSGYKTQSLSRSQAGDGGYNQLVFDDTPDRLRVQLSTTQYATALALGHIKQQADNQRLADRGYGAELRSNAFGALRAGAGLLLSTEPAGPSQLHAEEGVQSLRDAQRLQDTLAGHAQSAGGHSQAAPPHLQSLERLCDSLEQVTAGEGRGGEQNAAPAWATPDLLISAPAGIACLAAGDQLLCAGETLGVTARDIGVLSRNNNAVAAAAGLTLFTRGRPPGSTKPNRETGIALHSAKGPVRVQAQSDRLRIAAAQAVTLASTEAKVDMSARQSLSLSAAGSGVVLADGNITLSAAGSVTFHAAQHVLTAGQTAEHPAPKLPSPGELHVCEFRLAGAERAGDGLVVLDG